MVVEYTDRVIAEPIITSLLIVDDMGEVHAAYRWYATKDVVLECYESEQEMATEVVLVPTGDARKKVVDLAIAALKGALLRSEKGDTVEIVTNDIAVANDVAAAIDTAWETLKQLVSVN
ncbi:MAG: hypothetical protein QXT28_06255 [Thermofilaceae archaeon]